MKRAGKLKVWAALVAGVTAATMAAVGSGPAHAAICSVGFEPVTFEAGHAFILAA
jgi:hypothetical protein